MNDKRSPRTYYEKGLITDLYPDFHWNSSAERTAVSKQVRSRHRLSNLIQAAYKYRRLQPLCLRLCLNLEQGPFYSSTLREILNKYHGVTIGQYSYGAILSPGVLPQGPLSETTARSAPGSSCTGAIIPPTA